MAADIPGSQHIRYRLRQPVDEVNLLPPPDVDAWPVHHPDIVLRAREWQRAREASAEVEATPNDNVPEVLLSDAAGFTTSRPSFEARFDPPSIDEFTLRRRVTPRPCGPGWIAKLLEQHADSQTDRRHPNGMETQTKASTLSTDARSTFSRFGIVQGEGQQLLVET